MPVTPNQNTRIAPGNCRAGDRPSAKPQTTMKRDTPNPQVQNVRRFRSGDEGGDEVSNAGEEYCVCAVSKNHGEPHERGERMRRDK